MKSHPKADQVVTKKGYQPLEECIHSIKMHATNISKDMTSTVVTQGRIASLRSVLDLLEHYNNQLISLENNSLPSEILMKLDIVEIQHLHQENAITLSKLKDMFETQKRLRRIGGEPCYTCKHIAQKLGYEI